MVEECLYCIGYQTCLFLFILIFSAKDIQGLQCLSCTGAVTPTDCDTIKRCGPHENCFTEVYVSDSGVIRYHLGCKDIQQCSSQHGKRNFETELKIHKSLEINNISNVSKFSYLTANSSGLKHYKPYADHRRSQDLLVCSECCASTICNSAGCGHSGYTSPRGPVCLNCPQQRTPGDCDKITVCGVDQVCMLNKIPGSVTHHELYETKCEEEMACSVKANALTSAIIGKRQLTAHCCKGELCNIERSFNSSPSAVTLTSPVPVIMTSPLPVTMDYPCISNPCVRGTCSPDNDTYHCICENGFSGRHCDEILIDETSTSTSVITMTLQSCMSNPCVYGKCEPYQTTYICHCDHGYYGRNCDHYAVQITNNIMTTSLSTSYVTNTPPIDSTISNTLGFCHSNPGAQVICGHGTCVNSGTGYTCHCDDGYQGANCIEKQTCFFGMQCFHGGKCFLILCNCRLGYHGSHCELLDKTVPVNFVVGDVVVRGPDWNSGNEDGHGLGKVISKTSDGGVHVLWQTGVSKYYAIAPGVATLILM